MSNYSKSKSELSMTGAEASGLLHNNFSTTPPPQLFPCQYKPQQASFQQAPVLQSTETVVIHYQAINTYGGALVMEYPKRKPARKGFFYK
ncbi:hypothetical protein HanRHA438_Chr06g0260791 [Helianthus annuus]|nr:hypothetical protein HanRHA438_Chr06g0260791 [Helianthus annuus]